MWLHSIKSHIIDELRFSTALENGSKFTKKAQKGLRWRGNGFSTCPVAKFECVKSENWTVPCSLRGAEEGIYPLKSLKNVFMMQILARNCVLPHPGPLVLPKSKKKLVAIWFTCVCVCMQYKSSVHDCIATCMCALHKKKKKFPFKLLQTSSGRPSSFLANSSTSSTVRDLIKASSIMWKWLNRINTAVGTTSWLNTFRQMYVFT
jgi:hypothetical protein